MNAGSQPLIVLQEDCDSAVTQVTAALKSDGCSVFQSFDLLSAMKDADSCTCQMVVLLVYAQKGPPATLIFDSNQTQTIVYLICSPSQSAPPGLIEKLIQLNPNAQSYINPITPGVE